MSNKAKFKCSQPALYEICENTWKLCETYLSEFTDYSTIYDAAYVQHNLQLINAARQLKSDKERKKQAKIARQELKDKLPNFFNLHNRLTGYINHVYSPSIAKIQVKSTLGSADIKKARVGNWLEISAIITASTSYISANEARLIAEAQMPATFLSTFTAFAQSMQAIQDSITAGDSNAVLGTSNKLDANNLIYDKLMQLIQDANATFMPDNPVLTLFSFAYQKRQFVATKSAGINVSAIDAATKKYLPNVNISNQDPNNPKTGVTNAQGKCKIIQIPADTYDILFEAEGYEPLILAGFKIKTGNVSRIKIELNPLGVN